jgi:hypothetical protein
MSRESGPFSLSVFCGVSTERQAIQVKRAAPGPMSRRACLSFVFLCPLRPLSFFLSSLALQQQGQRTGQKEQHKNAPTAKLFAPLSGVT